MSALSCSMSALSLDLTVASSYLPTSASSLASSSAVSSIFARRASRVESSSLRFALSSAVMLSPSVSFLILAIRFSISALSLDFTVSML